ncbi:MAG TPA: hypothetical protein VGY58_20685 [Gemmataceae bacterium]|nr:hypothetical protein [Gemmataceae bacterium]
MSAVPSSPPNASATPEAIHQLECTLRETVPALIRQGRAAWRRDLPTLLRTHPGQWVAYHGERQIAVGGNKTDLVQQCLRSGLQRGDFLVLRIEPDVEQHVTLPLDV